MRFCPISFRQIVMSLPKFTTLMRLAVNFITRRDIAVFWCGIEVVALLWSKFLVSLSMIVLGLIASCELRWISRLRLMLPPQYGVRLRAFFDIRRYAAWWSISVLFWLMLISGLWSEDLAYWWSRTKLYLPFFILPLIFYLLPTFNKNNYFSILYFFVIAITFFCIGILLNYAFHFKDINEGLLRGQPIPTPRDHINFNFLLVFAFFCSIELWKNKIYWRRSAENLSMPPYALVIGKQTRIPEWENETAKKQYIFMAGITFFLFLTQHILAVRGGLLTMYLVLVYQICMLIIYQKKWVLGIGACLILFFSAWTAWHTMPSIQNRVRFMRWDLQQFQEKKYANNSDAERVVAMLVGVELWKRSPYFGIGAGDVWRESEKIYQTKYPDLTPKIPHSQLLVVAVAVGAMGLALFLGVYAWAFWHLRKNNLWVSLLLIYAIPLFFETLPESSFGVILFAFFAALIVKIETRGFDDFQIKW